MKGPRPRPLDDGDVQSGHCEWAFPADFRPFSLPPFLPGREGRGDGLPLARGHRREGVAFRHP